MEKYKEPEIQNSDIEGECQIEKIEPYKLSKLKILFSIFLGLCTAGLIGAVFKFSLKVRLLFFYKKARFEKATHFLVLN